MNPEILHHATGSRCRLKLCYICEATAGGVRKHLRELVRAFSGSAAGFEMRMLLGDRHEPGFAAEVEQFRAAGVQVDILPELAREIRPVQDVRAYRHLKARLKLLAPDIVHTHGSKAGFLGRLAAHATGVRRIVHTPHVFPFQWTTGLRRSLYLALERHAAQRGHAVVCVGPGQREHALALGVASAERLVLIPNGVPLVPELTLEAVVRLRMELQVPQDAEVVGMVARLAPQKGVRFFLDAAVQVLRQRPQAVFVLVGGGPLEHETRARAAAAGLDPERMRILGHREDAERLYPAFDVLVLSSLYEGLPYVLLEAMACGVPVVATDVPGSHDVLAHGEAGLLAQPHELAMPILRLLGDANLRKQLGAQARQRVREAFSLEQFVTGHHRLYRGPA